MGPHQSLYVPHSRYTDDIVAFLADQDTFRTGIPGESHITTVTVPYHDHLATGDPRILGDEVEHGRVGLTDYVVRSSSGTVGYETRHRTGTREDPLPFTYV